MASIHHTVYDGEGNVIEEYDVELSAQDANERTLREKAEQAIANLEAADANWGSLTAAQKDAATRLAVRASAKLARLALGRLEAS